MTTIIPIITPTSAAPFVHLYVTDYHVGLDAGHCLVCGENEYSARQPCQGRLLARYPHKSTPISDRGARCSACIGQAEPCR